MKKIGLILAGVALAMGTLTGCTYKAGDPCDTHGMAGKDDKGHDLICGKDQKGDWVWIRV